MQEGIESIKSWFIELFQVADTVARQKAVDTIEYETGELEHIFGLLVCGAFVGLPSPPVHLTLALLPLMETEIKRMLCKVTVAHDPLGELFSVLGVD